MHSIICREDQRAAAIDERQRVGAARRTVFVIALGNVGNENRAGCGSIGLPKFVADLAVVGGEIDGAAYGGKARWVRRSTGVKVLNEARACASAVADPRFETCESIVCGHVQPV